MVKWLLNIQNHKSKFTDKKSDIRKSEISKSVNQRSEISKSEISKSDIRKSEVSKSEISKSQIQPVSHTLYRYNNITCFLSYFANMHINGPISHDNIRTPDFIQYFIPRENTSRL